MNLKELQDAATLRADTKDWEGISDGPQLGNALAGKVGKVAGGLKKYDRDDPNFQASLFGGFLADVVIYCCLIASKFQIDLGAACVEKFNADSKKTGSGIMVPPYGDD